MRIIVLIGLVYAALMYWGYGWLCKYTRGIESVSAGKKRRKKGAPAAMQNAGLSTEQEKKIGFSLFVTIMIVTFLVRIAGAAIYKGYEVDINCFLAWADMIFDNGIGNFYTLDAFTDYPPGYMYILYVIGALRSVFGIAQTSALSIIMTKLPSILSDMAIGWLIYTIASKKMKETGAAWLAGIFLITPAVFLDSAIWAQVDSVFTLFIVLMCYLVTEKKLIPAYFVFAVGILIKPQSLIFTPVLLFGIIDQIFLQSFRNDARQVFYKKFWLNLGCGILAILMIGLLMLPFGFHEALGQYTETLGSYPYASVNAYNFWTMIGRNWADQQETLFGIAYQTWGMISIVATVIFTAFIHFKSRDFHSKYYFSAALLVTFVFTLSVRMHERYVYPAIILLLCCYAVRPRKKLFLAYVIVATGSFFNMAHVMFYYDPNNFDNMEAFPIFIGMLMVAFWCYMVYLAFACYAGYVSDKEENAAIRMEALQLQKNGREEVNIIRTSDELGRMVKIDFILMAAITLIYAVVAFVNLGDRQAPETAYSFVENDEVILDFGESVSIAKMWNFLGYLNNPKYTVSSLEDEDSEWVDIYTEQSLYDAGSVFCWNERDLNTTGRFVRIAASEETYQDSMIELIFTDASGNVLTPVNASEYPELFDEQDMFTGRRSWRNGTYFDEIYHARTAYEMIHHLYCYENTHPPLGKIFIAIGVLMFGMNPFGWRFMGTLFGVLMLPIFYIFAKKFFKETWISFIATVLFAFDFMHFAQTRIATIDVFVTLFIILAYFFMFWYTRKSFYDTSLRSTFIPLGLCGIAMGFSWACKWTGIYASAGLCIIFFLTMAQRFREYIYASKHPNGTTQGISHRYIMENFYPKFFKTIGFCCIFFLLVPAVIYTLSYIPMSDGTDRGLLQRMLANQQTMFSYHSNLESTHPYSSMWYEWPIMKRPIWFYSGTISETLKEGISSFGNPLVWWAGIPAFIMVLYFAVFEKDRKAGFLSLAYLSQYLPWVFIGRVVFIYHYFPSVPFVTLMLGYCMQKITGWKPKLKPVFFVYAGAAIVLFIMFYPVLTGVPVDPLYVKKYLKWFKSWVLISLKKPI